MVDEKDTPINRIYEITKKLINRDGFYKVTKESIAKESGIKVEVIDQYFPDGIVAILKGVVQHQATDFLNKVDFNLVTIGNLAKSLKYFLELYIKWHRENAAFDTALEIAYLSNKEAFKGYEDIFITELSAAPLVAQVLRHFGFKEGEDFDKLVGLIIHTLDSLVHRHVIYGNIVEDDSILIDFLISLSVGFINYSVQFQRKK